MARSKGSTMLVISILSREFRVPQDVYKQFALTFGGSSDDPIDNQECLDWLLTHYADREIKRKEYTVIDHDDLAQCDLFQNMVLLSLPKDERPEGMTFAGDAKVKTG